MNGYFVFAVVVLACAALLLVLLRRCDRKKIGDDYQRILKKLDRALGGEIQPAVYDESQEDAVTERLNRLVSVSGMNQDRAERERDIVKSFISDISHQVRTPLANIMLYAGLLQERGLDEESTVLAEKIRKQSDKLGFFMKELMQAAYAEQEIISIHPTMARVDELISSACQLVELEALKKKIQIMQEETNLSCYADPKWTIEAIGNVLDNAVKYSPEHSQIEISIIAYEAFACIMVQDQGMGIREEEQGRVFERFYRSDAASSAPGLGIGLYLVREVLAKQGGYAKLNSSPGEGTAVCLYLSRYAKG